MDNGDKEGPSQISPEEEELRWKLALNRITFDEYKKRMEKLRKEGKVYMK